MQSVFTAISIQNKFWIDFAVETGVRFQSRWKWFIQDNSLHCDDADDGIQKALFSTLCISGAPHHFLYISLFFKKWNHYWMNIQNVLARNMSTLCISGAQLHFMYISPPAKPSQIWIQSSFYITYHYLKKIDFYTDEFDHGLQEE